MSAFDVIILTDSRYINPASPGEYVLNILKEDAIVLQALEDVGLTVGRKDWADPDFNWANTASVLFRSTWDYFDRFGEFRAWLEDISLKTKLINSSDLVNWNIDKHYLEYLYKKHVNIVPTRYLLKGSGLSLEEFHSLTGWKHTVVKPTVGGAGRHTYVINEENLRTISNKLSGVMKTEDFMLQPFQHSVPVHGEWSFVFFGKQFSHAVLKKAKPGDFRVQDDFGGTVHKYSSTPEEIEFGLSAVEACPELPVYSRVDVVIDNEGNLAVSELELIEPELWFRLYPEGASLLAGEVKKKLSEIKDH